MSLETTDTRLAAAQEAADQHAWQEAYTLLTDLDRDGRLDAAGLELLATIAWWASQPDVSVAARERAFSAYLQGGDRDLADYRRAGQWTEVAERWCERQAISGFPSVCRVHRAEILALHGQWTDALA